MDIKNPKELDELINNWFSYSQSFSLDQLKYIVSQSQLQLNSNNYKISKLIKLNNKYKSLRDKSNSLIRKTLNPPKDKQNQ